MKHKLLNKLWLRVGMIVAIMTTALAGTAWAEEVTFNFPEIASAESWENGVAYTSYTISPITVEALGGGNNGKYYTSSNGSWRMYSGGTVSITAASGYTITGVSSNPSCNFTVSNGTATFSPSARTDFKTITVTYTSGSSSAVATTTSIDATGITNTDVYAGTAAGTLSATVTTGGTAVSGATVTWSSSNENVATIDANGAVTLVAAGTTNIKASYAGVANQYQASSDTYEMTVTDSTPFSGGDITFVGGTDLGTTTTNADGDEVTKSVVTISSSIAAFATSEYRFYKDSETTISTSQGVITSIVFTCNSSSYPASRFSEQTGWTTSGNNGTWTGSASSVSFTASGGQVRANKIVVTVDMGATPDPVINADNVNITYDATSGTIEYTIVNPVVGASFSASTTDTWLTLGTETSSTVPFTCTANGETTARTATVTLTYGDVTKDVTITQGAAPVSYATIPALFAAATTAETAVYVTFNNWVVSGVSTNGKNVFVTDNNGNGFVIYSSSDQSSTYSVGNILSGTAVSCTLKKYNGFAELINVDAADLTITTGGTVSVASVAMADLAGVNTGALVSYENLTCSVDNNKYYLSDGTTTLQVYNSLFAFDALEDGKTYNITGIYQQFNSTKEILPRSAADIEEVTSTEPSVTVTPATINAPYEGADGTLALAYENITDFISFDYYFCDDEGNELQEDPDWIFAEIQEENDSYSLYYVIDANDGEARTAYIKVYTLDDNLEEVSSIVTVTQAAYVAPVLDYASLPFEFDGGKADIESTAGLTQTGLGSDYNSSPKLKFDNTGDELILAFNSRPGTLTFEIKGNTFSGGTFKVQTSVDGITYNDLATYTELGATKSEEFTNIPASVRFIKWVYTEKVSGNVALGNINLAKYSTEPVLAVNPSITNLGTESTSGTLEVTATNFSLSDVEEGDFQFFEYNGSDYTSSSNPDWLTLAYDYENEKINYSVDTNGGAARSAYFKLILTYNEDDIYSDIITINQEAFVAPIEGAKYVKVTSTDDLTDGQYLIVYEDGSIAFDGSREGNDLNASGNYINVNISDNEIAATEATVAAEFTLDVAEGTILSASGYYIGQTSDANGLASSTETAYTNTIDFTDGNADIVSSGGAYLRYNASASVFRYYKSSTYAGQKAVQLYKFVAAPTSQTVTVSAVGYATFVAEADLEIPENVEIFAVTVNSTATSAHLEPITGGIPSGEAVLIRASEGSYEFPRTAEVVAEVPENDLQADVTSDVTADGTQYCLANKDLGVGFYQVQAGIVIPAGKAYLVITPSAGGAKAFYGFDDNATGIENLNANANLNDVIYNVAGQRLNKVQKGINIVNGKKILK